MNGSYIRDLKIRGREGQDGNGSGRGKLARVPSCRQKQNNVFSYRTATSITGAL